MATATSVPKLGTARALGPVTPSAASRKGDRTDGRVGAGHVREHSGHPSRGLVSPVGGAATTFACSRDTPNARFNAW
jgi:hypothetical protein